MTEDDEQKEILKLLAKHDKPRNKFAANVKPVTETPRHEWDTDDIETLRELLRND